MAKQNSNDYLYPTKTIPASGGDKALTDKLNSQVRGQQSERQYRYAQKQQIQQQQGHHVASESNIAENDPEV